MRGWIGGGLGGRREGGKGEGGEGGEGGVDDGVVGGMRG